MQRIFWSTVNRFHWGDTREYRTVQSNGQKKVCYVSRSLYGCRDCACYFWVAIRDEEDELAVLSRFSERLKYINCIEFEGYGRWKTLKLALTAVCRTILCTNLAFSDYLFNMFYHVRPVTLASQRFVHETSAKVSHSWWMVQKHMDALMKQWWYGDLLCSIDVWASE